MAGTLYVKRTAGGADQGTWRIADGKIIGITQAFQTALGGAAAVGAVECDDTQWGWFKTALGAPVHTP